MKLTIEDVYIQPTLGLANIVYSYMVTPKSIAPYKVHRPLTLCKDDDGEWGVISSLPDLAVASAICAELDLLCERHGPNSVAIKQVTNAIKAVYHIPE